MTDGGWVPGPALDEPGEATDPAPARELAYPNLDAWVRGHLALLSRRRLGGGLTWCAQWWRHAEAVSRLNALWQEWEKARIEGAMSTWWTSHHDPHMAVLMSKDAGPFMACKPNEHRELEALPVAPSDPSLWLGGAFSEPARPR